MEILEDPYRIKSLRGRGVNRKTETDVETVLAELELPIGSAEICDKSTRGRVSEGRLRFDEYFVRTWWSVNVSCFRTLPNGYGRDGQI